MTFSPGDLVYITHFYTGPKNPWVMAEVRSPEMLWDAPQGQASEHKGKPCYACYAFGTDGTRTALKVWMRPIPPLDEPITIEKEVTA